MTANSPGQGASPARLRVAVLGAGATLAAALGLAFLLGCLLGPISIDQPLDPGYLMGWGWRWGLLLAASLATGSAVGQRRPAPLRQLLRLLASTLALVLLVTVLSALLAVILQRLGVFGGSWTLASRAGYAARLGAERALEVLILPSALGAAGLLWWQRGRSRPLGSASPQHPLRPDQLDRLSTFVGGLMVVTSLGGGLPFLLRRIGWLDGAAYQQDLARFCQAPIQTLWLPQSCHGLRLVSLHPFQAVVINSKRLFTLSAAEWLTKLACQGLLGAVLVLSLLLLASGRIALPPWRRWRSLAPLLLPLVLSLGLGLAISLRQGQIGPVLVSLVGLGWLPLTFVGGWLTTPPRLARMARALEWLVLLQLPLLMLEAMRGLPLRSGSVTGALTPAWPPLPTRLTGSFSQPNTLGVVAVVALAFCLAFSQARPRLPWLTLAVTVEVLLARSATGMLGLLVVLAFQGMPGGRRRGRHRARHRARRWPGLADGLGKALLGAALVVLVIGLVVNLPRVLNRPDLLASPLGRLRNLERILSLNPPTGLVVGYGLASGGNLVWQLKQASPSWPVALRHWLGTDDGTGGFIPTESLLGLLLIQGGLPALLSVLGLLGWGLRHDRRGRPLLAILTLASFTCSLGEMVPVNLMLALALHHALFRGSTASGQGPRAAPAAGDAAKVPLIHHSS